MHTRQHVMVDPQLAGRRRVIDLLVRLVGWGVLAVTHRVIRGGVTKKIVLDTAREARDDIPVMARCDTAHMTGSGSRDDLAE